VPLDYAADMTKVKSSNRIQLECLVFLFLVLKVQLSFGDDWAEAELKRLEEGCLELSYDALTQRWISILGLYKYTDNPDGYWKNKCYLKLKQLGDERVAKYQDKIKQFEENAKRSEQIRKQNEEIERQNRQNQDAEQAKLNKEG